MSDFVYICKLAAHPSDSDIINDIKRKKMKPIYLTLIVAFMACANVAAQIGNYTGNAVVIGENSTLGIDIDETLEGIGVKLKSSGSGENYCVVTVENLNPGGFNLPLLELDDVEIVNNEDNNYTLSRTEPVNIIVTSLIVPPTVPIIGGQTIQNVPVSITLMSGSVVNDVLTFNLKIVVTFSFTSLTFDVAFEGVPDVALPKIRYVKANGTAASNAASATSWETACADLQAVINASKAGDEIWVAAGAYKPNRRADALTVITANDRDNAFVLKKDVKIYGSFEGTETALEERQLPVTGDYTSILSGDFNGNDGNNFTNMDENAYHVVVSVDDVGSACLDGFTISGGNANGGGGIIVNSIMIIIMQDTGGGIGNYHSLSSPRLSNLNITGNAASDGGGIYNYTDSSPTLTNVSISGNMAGNYGGGMCNYYSSPILTNVSINGNTAAIYGGGMYNNGSYASNIVLTNVSIIGNIAYNNGSGMYNTGGWESPPSKIRNSIIWGNGMASYNVFNGNYFTITYDHSLVEGVTEKGVILAGQNPMFVDAANGNLRLQASSPCIDAGDNSFFAVGKIPDLSAITTDLAGNPRFNNGKIDLGAYEYQGFVSIKTPQTNVSDFVIYPNPVKDELTIKNVETAFGGSQLTINKVEIVDLSGKTIYQSNNFSNQINVSMLSQGIYFVKIETDKGIVTKKLVKE